MDVKGFVLNEVQDFLKAGDIAKEDTNFKANCVTSLEKICLVMACEKKYHIRVPDALAHGMETPNELISFVEAKLRGKSLSIAP